MSIIYNENDRNFASIEKYGNKVYVVSILKYEDMENIVSKNVYGKT